MVARAGGQAGGWTSRRAVKQMSGGAGGRSGGQLVSRSVVGLCVVSRLVVGWRLAGRWVVGQWVVGRWVVCRWVVCRQVVDQGSRWAATGQSVGGSVGSVGWSVRQAGGWSGGQQLLTLHF